MGPDIIQMISQVVAVFDELETKYLIGGSVASMQYGEIRYTNDIDFVAFMSKTD